MSKFAVDCVTHGEVTNCKLIGVIDEDFSPGLFNLPGKTVIFDFNLLETMNSCGIREWIKFLATLSPRRIVYERCPRILVDQMNMIRGFLPQGATVRSVYAPFYSPEEEEEIDLLIQLEGFQEGNLHSQVHPQTGKMLEFDDIPSQYFAFLKGI